MAQQSAATFGLQIELKLAKKRIAKLEKFRENDNRIIRGQQAQLAELREAAATYKNNGHSPSCRRHTLYTKGGRCICGYDELEQQLAEAKAVGTVSYNRADTEFMKRRNLEKQLTALREAAQEVYRISERDHVAWNRLAALLKQGGEL